MNKKQSLLILLISITICNAYLQQIEVITILETTCQERCLIKFKVNEICKSFCSFVDHVVSDHLPQIQKEADSREQLEVAMEETVNIRIQSFIEDDAKHQDHSLGDILIERMRNWKKFLKPKDEL